MAPLSSLPVARQDRQFAIAVVALSALVFVGLAPFAQVPLGRLDAFIPIYQSALVVNDLLTAALLLTRAPHLRSRAMLVLACGYLFSALMASAHMLTFPGLFAPAGLLGAGPQTTAWLYMFWHAGFPLAVVVYVVLGRHERAPEGAAAGGFPIFVAIAITAATAYGLTLLATSGQALLPSIMEQNHYTPAMIVVVSATWAFSLVALAALWRRRARSVLDLWLMVVMCAWMFDIALSAVLNAGRFDLGFYAGRVYGLLAATFVLIVLLNETAALYRLAWRTVDARTAELRRTSGELQSLVDCSPLPIVALDLSQRVVMWNRAAEQVFGYTAEEVLGQPYPLVPETARDEYNDLVRRVIAEGEWIRGVSVGRRRKDGRVLDVRVSGAPLRGPGGGNVGAVYVLDDVTEKSRTEEKLRQTEESFRLFADNVRDHTLVMLDAAGRLATWNAGAERLLGYDEADALGRHVSVLYAEEDRQQDLPARALKLTLTNGHHEENGWRCRRDGTTFWANMVLTALRAESGALRGFGLVIRDFTERRKAEEARALNDRIFATSLDLILVTDRRGNFILVSPSSQSLLGYAPPEMIGRSGIEFIHPEDLDSTRDEMRQARRTGSMRNFHCRYVHRDGRAVTLAWTGVWSEDEQRHFFIGRDMTEAQKRERQLVQAQKMEAVGQLTGGLAHDFNNLLGIVIGNLDLIQEELAKDHAAQPLVQAALEACLRGAQLNKSLLAFSRRQDLVPRRVDTASVVGDTAKMLRRIIGERIEVQVGVADELWPINVDVSQLEAAILNLAVNARDAMPDGGRLVIEASNRVLDTHYAAENTEVSPGDYAMIAITDSGAGMAPDVLARVFEPFFTTKEVGKGTGLGLSMVHGFIKQSRGHVKIYSEPGRGTTVRLYLPRDRGDIDGARDTEIEAQALRATAGGIVLVVEDNESLRRVAAARIHKLGYRVIEASTAAEALQAIDDGATPDLLFTDVVMPGTTDGIALAREAVRRIPNLRVLLTSGFTERGAGAANGQRPPWPLLSKPYRNAELARSLRDAMAHQETAAQ